MTSATSAAAAFPEKSSFYQHWLFKPEDYENIRQATFSAARTKIEEEIREAGNSVEDVKFPTVEECDTMIQYFISQLLFVCREKKFDYKVTNTAAVLLARFYLRRSPLEYDPRVMLLTCILLAIKIEECANSILLQQFCEGIIGEGVGLADVVNKELIILEAINFELIILTPRTPLQYLTTEYYEQYKVQRPPPQASAEAQAAAIAELSKLSKMVADVNAASEQIALKSLINSRLIFTTSPSHIAVAAFILAAVDKLPHAEELVKTAMAKVLKSPAQEMGALQAVEKVKAELLVLLQLEQAPLSQATLKSLKKISRINKARRPTGKG